MRRIYDSPTRIFILSMGRKNGKTAFAAFLLLLHLCGPESKPNSQLMSAAQSRDQAAIIFALAAKIVRMSPDFSSVVVVRDSVKELLCPELGTLYKALSADASTAYGLSPAFVVHDELGQVRGPRSELYEALETAAAAQAEPLSVVISTQAPTDADLLSLLVDDARTGADPRNKVEIYTAPTDLDPFVESTIRLANPHFDELMNAQEVLRQATDAQRLPSREASYRNLILNQRVEAYAPFVTRAVWEENGGDPGDPKGRKVWVGLDLSSVADLTAMIAVDETGGVHCRFWLPAVGLPEKSRQDRVPYDLWAEQGFLATTPGNAIEYEFVAEYLRGFFDVNDVQKVAFDRALMNFLTPWLAKAGFAEQEMTKFQEYGQGTLSMTPALRELETKLLNRQLRHGKHPVLAMCAANARVVGDSGARKFDKRRASGRIDGMVALAMAVGVMPAKVDAKPTFQAFTL